jgi:hypothetical protein
MAGGFVNSAIRREQGAGQDEPAYKERGKDDTPRKAGQAEGRPSITSRDKKGDPGGSPFVGEN